MHDLLRSGWEALAEADWDGARSSFEEARELDESAEALDGLSRALHEAMTAVSAGEVVGIVPVGDICCRLLSACELALDVTRAEQWMSLVNLADRQCDSEQNKATVRACFENAAQGNYDALGEIVAPDYVLHPEEVRGAEGPQETVERYRNALGGLRVTIDQQFTGGDYVATRFTIRGTHDGDLMGIPPTGKDVTFTGITISRCEGGRIMEEWELVDTVGLLGQVGALPALAAS